MAQANLEGDLSGLVWKHDRERSAAVIYWHVEGNSRGAMARGPITGWSALGLLCRSTGARAWVWDWRDRDGRKHRRQYKSPEEMSFAQALREVLRDRATLEEGVGLERKAEPPSSGATVKALLDEYLDLLARSPRRGLGVKRRPEYVEKVRRELALVRSMIGHREAGAVTTGELERALDQFVDRPASLERLEAHLSAVFAFGERRGYCAKSPFEAVERRGHSSEREKYLDDAELRLALPKIEALGYPNGDVFMLALLTGRRLSEITQAQWSEFDLDRGTWTLPEIRAKNRTDGHMLPLPPTALRLLRAAAERKVGDGQFVFHRTGTLERDRPIDNIKPYVKAVREAMASATAARLEAAQREPFEFHDTRRTTATWLERLGAPDAVIKEVLNHSRKGTLGVTSVYARSFRDTAYRLQVLREWLTKLDMEYQSLRPLALPAPAEAAQ